MSKEEGIKKTFYEIIHGEDGELPGSLKELMAEAMARIVVEGIATMEVSKNNVKLVFPYDYLTNGAEDD